MPSELIVATVSLKRRKEGKGAPAYAGSIMRNRETGRSGKMAGRETGSNYGRSCIFTRDLNPERDGYCLNRRDVATLDLAPLRRGLCLIAATCKGKPMPTIDTALPMLGHVDTLGGHSCT